MRFAALGLAVLLLGSGCPRAEEKPAESAPPPSSPRGMDDSSAPAPLPPEEVAPPESAPPLDPPDAKPVEPGITATGAPTRGKLPKAIIDQTLKSAEPEILACYEQALKRNPELRGMVNVDFVVGTEGKVVHAAAAPADDLLADDGAVRCILRAIEKLEFPPPVGGRVFIQYPLDLKPPKP